MNVVFSLICFLCAHSLGAFLIYANHRFVLHGPLGRLGPLRWARHLHALHHKYAYPRGQEDFYHVYFSRTPRLVGFILTFLAAFVTLFLPAFGLGLVTTIMYYEIMHRMAHGSWRTSSIGKHHELHHKFPKCNYSGMYPVIDKIFGTRR